MSLPVLSRYAPYVVLFSFFLCQVTLQKAFSQTARVTTRTSVYASPVVDIYHDAMKESMGLFTGREYTNTTPRVAGHPFFISNEFVNGEIQFDSIIYPNIPVMYDIYQDKLLTQHPNKLFKIELVKENVNFFRMEGRTFVPVNPADYQNKEALSGFYQLVYDGYSKVYLKNVKWIEEFQSNGGIQKEFNPKTFYYLLKDNKMIEVSGKNSALNLFKEHKKALKSRFKESKISYKTDKEKALAFIAAQADILSHQ